MSPVRQGDDAHSGRSTSGNGIERRERGAPDFGEPQAKEISAVTGPSTSSLGDSLNASSSQPQDDGLLSPSPLATVDGNHLSPYAHLSGHLSDSAYDNFSDYTTPDFEGDDFSEFALPPMSPIDLNQDDQSVTETQQTDPTSDFASKGRTSSTGDSITHPSTRLLSPVPSNPTFSRASTANDISTPNVIIQPDITSAGRISESNQPRSVPQAEAGDSAIPLESVINFDVLNSNSQSDSKLHIMQESQSAPEVTKSGPSLQGISRDESTRAAAASTKFTQGSHEPKYASGLDTEEQTPEPSQTRRGVDPTARKQMNEAIIPTLEEQQKERELAATKAGVEKWLTTTATNEMESPNTGNDGDRQGIKIASGRQSKDDWTSIKAVQSTVSTPGPGVYINQEDDEEDEEDDDDDDDGEAPSESDDDATPPATYNPNGTFRTLSDASGAQTAPWARRPWADSPLDSDSASLRGQPTSSNAAIARFERRAKDTETASVTATIASSFRRRSLESLFSAANISVVPPSEADSTATSRVPDASDRRTTLLGRILPKRSNSNVKKRKESRETEQKPSEDDKKKESQGSLSSITRVHSWARAKSPSPSTSNHKSPPLSQLPKSATALSPSPGPWTSVANVIKRARSKSDLGHTSALAEQWRSWGGPPVANLRLPTPDQEPENVLDRQNSFEVRDSELDGDGDGDHTPTGPMDMSLGPLIAPDAPTPESFKAHVLEGNPRIEPYMLERVTSEQLKRFRRLVEASLNHATQVDRMECKSGEYCSDLGGGPTMLEPRRASADSEAAAVTFYINRASPNDSAAVPDDDSIPANFPEGIPLPPSGVHRLPAEFECPLCFQVKKILKPSDWTKHVHEDLQPFTCSFPDCVEPKSFKRKADWVRHENERHRQLEKWICKYEDCHHVCFRKDNFVQHLVREHKLPEPKVRATKASARFGAQDQSEVPKLTEECRYDTSRRPDEESCRFCGNYLTSWKKLSAHLAKHMEHISLPVLLLTTKVEHHQGGIMSPIDQELNNSRQDSAGAASNPIMHEYSPLSTAYGNFEGVNKTEGGQSQLDGRTPTPNRVDFQDHGEHTPVNVFAPVARHADPGVPNLTTESYPGSRNVQRGPSPFDNQLLVQPPQFVADDSLSQASPSETYISAFDNSENILPGSQSHSASLTYPPSFMAPSSQPQADANLTQTTLYSNSQLYDNAFSTADYNQQNYQYAPAATTTLNVQYVRGPAAQYAQRAQSHTPTAQFSQIGTAPYPRNSLTPTNEYSQATSAQYSKSTTAFSQLSLNPYAQMQPQSQQQGGSSRQQYVSPSADQDYFATTTSYGEQFGGTGQASTQFNQQQQYRQQQQQQQQYGAYYGS